MIIRSADKESIVNFDTMSMVQVEQNKEGKFMIYAYDSGTTVVTPIAKYSTREQAIKVLDEIQDRYSTRDIQTLGMGERTIQRDACKYYELPPDDPDYLENTEE